MNTRYVVAAAALVTASAALILIEPIVLGDLLSERRGGWLSAVVQHGPIVCGWVAAWCLAVGFGWLPRLRMPHVERTTRDAIAGFLTRGIPVADAHAVAVFRVVFALGLLVVLRAHYIEGQALLQNATRIAVVCFAAGFLTRAALVAATLGVWGWMFAWTQHFGSHPVSTLVIALPCLWPARWSDAWSVDAVLWRRQPGRPSVAYGYAIWMPRFVVGVALLAAAVAKLATPEWIVNGTVKFAFVADYHRASVPWGLWIASSPALAVAASAGAVIVEAVAITAAFSRSWIYRLTVGLMVATLFAGFFLLQGELWLGWCLLILAFLPWELVSQAGRDRDATATLSWAQWAAVTLVLAMQVVASAARLEIRPAISAYDMYSTTFDSTEAFDRANPMLEYRFEAETAAGLWTNVTECFERPLSTEMAAAWGADAAGLRRFLSRCEQPVPRDVRRLRLFESLRVFNWQTGELSWEYRDRVRWTVPI